MAKTATTTTTTVNATLVNTLNTLKSVVEQTATMAFASVNDIKSVKEIANGLMTVIKEAAELRFASIVKPTAAPAPTAKATKATAKTAKAAVPKPTKTTKAEKTAPKATKADRDAAADAAAEVLMADKKALKKLGLKFVAYKESQIILGDTKAIKDSLKALQTSQWGVYHFMAPATAPNGGGFAWAVNNKTADKVAKVLGIRYKKAQ